MDINVGEQCKYHHLGKGNGAVNAVVEMILPDIQKYAEKSESIP